MTLKNQFASDNYAGISPEAWQSLQDANTGYATSYGDDVREIMTSSHPQ